MYAFLITVHIIVSIVLILVILLQAGRGGGLSEAFGISSTQTLFGTSATRFLQRATSVCAVIFLLTCLTLAALSTQRSRSLMERQRMKKVAEDLVTVPAATKEATKPAPVANTAQENTAAQTPAAAPVEAGKK